MIASTVVAITLKIARKNVEVIIHVRIVTSRSISRSSRHRVFPSCQLFMVWVTSF